MENPDFGYLGEINPDLNRKISAALRTDGTVIVIETSLHPKTSITETDEVDAHYTPREPIYIPKDPTRTATLRKPNLKESLVGAVGLMVLVALSGLAAPSEEEAYLMRNSGSIHIQNLNSNYFSK